MFLCTCAFIDDAQNKLCYSAVNHAAHKIKSDTASAQPNKNIAKKGFYPTESATLLILSGYLHSSDILFVSIF
jgi:hypothetical protein